MPAQTRIAAARSHAATEPVCTHAALARIRRALLLERAFQIDLECPICGGALNIRAAIIEMPVIKRIHSPTRIVTLALRTAAFGPRAYKFAGLLWVETERLAYSPIARYMNKCSPAFSPPRIT